MKEKKKANDGANEQFGATRFPPSNMPGNQSIDSPPARSWACGSNVSMGCMRGIRWPPRRIERYPRNKLAVYGVGYGSSGHRDLTPDRHKGRHAFWTGMA